MPCESRETDRILYVYGEPPEGFVEHLPECAECALAVRRLEEVRESYASQPPPTPLPLPVRGNRFAAWLSIAAAVLVAGTGWILMTYRETPAAPPGSPVPMVSGQDIDREISRVRDRIAALRVADDEF